MFVLRTVTVMGVVLLVNGVHSWKPSSPTSFSISQQHPALGHSHNAISDPSTSGSFSDSQATAHSTASITYHGNQFLNDHAEGHDDDDGLVNSHLDSEPRILHSKDSFYGSNYYNALVPSAVGNGVSEQCSVDKYAFEHEGTVMYDQTLPKLDQFTLCAWMRFTNHSGDHTVFTYSLDDEPREIQFWVANANGASYFSMAVHGQSLFRLNYPLKMRKWHHACASWNGKTGEWQLWVKAERVGRGFHNRIVGHVIDPHGVLYSGGPSLTGPIDADLHMEVTMIQMYKVALSAGKAHRDHKHHHVHHFNHDGLATTTPAPVTQMTALPVQPVNPLLANGQIATRLRINLAGALNPEDQPQILVPAAQTHATIGTQFVSGQFSPAERFISQQLVGSQGPPQQIPVVQARGVFKFPSESSAPISYSSVSDAGNVQYLDHSGSTAGRHILFKRNNKGEKVVRKRSVAEKKHEKRALVQLTDGSVIDDSVIAANPFDFDGLAQFGAPAFQEQLNKQMDIEDEIKQHDREPAEGEVQAVLNLCNACAAEPFQGAIIFAWKDAKVQSKNALKGKSLGGCGEF